MADEQELRDLLAQLHARLSGATSIDPASRKLLTTLSADIEKTLARSGPAAASHQPRLEALAVQFEADHPALAGALRQIVDALGKVGI